MNEPVLKCRPLSAIDPCSPYSDTRSDGMVEVPRKTPTKNAMFERQSSWPGFLRCCFVRALARLSETLRALADCEGRVLRR